MGDSYLPKIDTARMILNPKIDTSSPMPIRMSSIKPVEDESSFASVMHGVIKGIDDQAKKPDKMMAEAMVNPNIDIHDVMIEANKSELTITIATQVTTKVIQGYEKIISMQV